MPNYRKASPCILSRALCLIRIFTLFSLPMPEKEDLNSSFSRGFPLILTNLKRIILSALLQSVPQALQSFEGVLVDHVQVRTFLNVKFLQMLKPAKGVLLQRVQRRVPQYDLAVRSRPCSRNTAEINIGADQLKAELHNSLPRLAALIVPTECLCAHPFYDRPGGAGQLWKSKMSSGNHFVITHGWIDE